MYFNYIKISWFQSRSEDYFCTAISLSASSSDTMDFRVSHWIFIQYTYDTLSRLLIWAWIHNKYQKKVCIRNNKIRTRFIT